MKFLTYFILSIFAILFGGCNKEYDCSDPQIRVAFVRFSQPERDTFIIRKYSINSNYQNQLDSIKVINGSSGLFSVNGDTTLVSINPETKSIKTGYDWTIFIPALNRTVFISNITSERKTGKCGSGLFSMDKFGCSCFNSVFSLKKDNQVINFSTPDPSRNFIFIDR